MKFDNIDDLATDVAKASEGVMMDCGGGRGFFVRKAGFPNREWVAALAEEFASGERTEDPQERRDRAVRRAVRTLIAGVFGFTYDAGVKVTVEELPDLFHEAPDLFDQVYEFATDPDNFRPGGLEQDSKSDS